ncbi:MAG: tyrosine-type recombinase/integrase [Aristaeellaceae bacterium]
MAKRAAQGAGTIRKKTITRNGKEYTYWEARITTGRDPGTGKQVQQSFSGKTQKEVREKMQAAAVAINKGTYTAPSKLTVGQWMDIWSSEYLGNVKPRTITNYKSCIRNHIVPALSAVKLADLRPHTVQTFINGIEGLSAGSLRLVYKVLHMALEKAVALEYIPKNPASNCVLPKDEKKDIKPLTDQQASAMLAAAKGNIIENLVKLCLFTGLRISEALGLTWDCVDLDKRTITVDKQLVSRDHRHNGPFATPKNGLTRTITVAPSVVATLKDQLKRLAEMRLKAGPAWHNEYNTVFATPAGDLLSQSTAANNFKTILKKAGIDDVRFHDLRHTYAVNAIRAGDDIKTIQGNLGHATAAFTLDRYGHFTERMKEDSAARMEAFIHTFLIP